MNKLINREKSPFLLAILLAIIGFQFNLLIKSILEDPIVEYKLNTEGVECKNDKQIKKISCLITNVTHKSSFKDLDICFRFKELNYAKLIRPKVITISPSSLNKHRYLSRLENNLLIYRIEHIQPGFKYKLMFEVESEKEKQDLPNIYVSSDDTVKFEKAGIKTFLIRNYLPINLIIIIIWLSLVTYYMYLIRKY